MTSTCVRAPRWGPGVFHRPASGRTRVCGGRRFAPAVLFDHQRQHLLDPFVGGETAGAAGAFASTADDLLVVARPGVHDLVVDGLAKRAAHGRGRQGRRAFCQPQVYSRALWELVRREAARLQYSATVPPRHHRRRTLLIDRWASIPARVAVERNEDVVPRTHVAAGAAGRWRPGRDRRFHWRRLGMACPERRAIPWSSRAAAFVRACSSAPASTRTSRRPGRARRLRRRDRHGGAAPRGPDRSAARQPAGRHADRDALHDPAQHRRLLHRRRRGAHLPPGARARHRRPGQARGDRRPEDAVPRRRGDAGGRASAW